MKILHTAALLTVSTGAFAQSAKPVAAAALASDNNRIVLNTMAQELQRNFDVLKKNADPPPYFLSYEITDQDTHSVSATLGVLNATGAGRNRYLDVTVRVGDPKLDNYRRVRGERIQFTSGAPVPIDDNPAAIRQDLWLETDRVYRAAAERLIKIKTNQQVKAADRDTSNDFSSEAAYAHFEKPAAFAFDVALWTNNVRDLSRDFIKYPDLLSSDVQVSFQADTRYFASSEGASVQHGRAFTRVIITAGAKAKDGMGVADFESFEAADPKDLPSTDVIRAAVKKVGENVEALTLAKTAEPFVGPAILSGRASGVFFHEIFGHRIEGHRQKDESEGQTFTKSVGEKILPDFLSVTFDPTMKRAAGVDLNGWYEYDDEGVPGEPVKAVENGVLKSFLMSRSPIDGFDHSNGHGRRQPGLEVVSRQSNLIVSSTKSVSDEKLRQLLIGEIKRQNKPYGLFFADITSGVTTTQRTGVQAFQVVPVIVYRVYADGRPDELIRGADIVGTPLASFAKILATSDRQEVFNGYCGAESGSVPVSAVAPAILISEIEIEKKDASQDLLPLLPSPLSLTAGLNPGVN
ncbi:MAG: metallopeptidase TldD-related protein [Acidobacteriota bacterium]|nr:metallopeptidase TldD-related protein [Acidobacteriota bacterium]